MLCRFLNHTKTRGGARLLRANLLQPLTSLDTVRMRQDAIQELVGNDDLAFTLGQGLAQMPKDLDRCAIYLLAVTVLITWAGIEPVLGCHVLQARPGVLSLLS